MASVTNYALECNNKIELNFDGGDLSSDSGLFLIKEFLEKIHFHNIAEHILMIEDQVKARIHSNTDILMQMSSLRLLRTFFTSAPRFSAGSSSTTAGSGS